MLMGIQGLIEEGDISTLLALEGNQNSVFDGSQASGRILDAIRYEFRNSDPVGVAALGRIATATVYSRPLRSAAAGALAMIHTKEALPYLAQLLDSSDIELRTDAVGGLSQFAMNVPVRATGVHVESHLPAPGDWPYRSDDVAKHSTFSQEAISSTPGYYEQFWKDWWAKNGVSAQSGLLPADSQPADSKSHSVGTTSR